jgi:hypothetical protein
VQYAEYLGEIREQVCGHCPERIPGRPFGPRCRRCGVELQLPQLVESIHTAGDYLDEFDPTLDREVTCSQCICLDGGNCPCPAGSLTGRLVRAVRNVDERRDQMELLRLRLRCQPRPDRAPVAELIEAYEAATGVGVYCD